MKILQKNNTLDFVNFYKQHVLEDNYFYYPFSIINYNKLKSITSLGYQGIFHKKQYTEKNLKDFLSIVNDFCIQHNIIAEFIRYNPYFENHNILKNVYKIDYIIDFYSIEVNAHYEIYLQNRPIRLRNAMNKTKSLEIRINNEIDKSLINKTLKYKNDFFYDSISLKKLLLSKNTVLLQAYLNNNEVASSLFLIVDNIAYYIANISNDIGKVHSANVFLIMEFYKYAIKNNIKFIGLGGGIKNNDSLVKFKEQFATNIYPIYHSKIIRNKTVYNRIKKTSDYFPYYLNNKSILKFIINL